MTLKTIRRIPTILVLGALAVVAIIVAPGLVDTRGDDQGLVVVTVSFDPPKRSGVAQESKMFPDYVTAVIIGTNSVMPTEHLRQSPKVWNLHPRKGQTIIVQAGQIYGRQLSCSITQAGAKGHSMTRNGPSEVTCKHTTI